jgi:hypothetical protein
LNQDQVKEKLLRLGEPGKDFSVVFSGKESRKVDGLYKPETREIILHNRNFPDDDSLIYTAIHEYAHHIHFVTSATAVSSKAHGVKFWSVFHGLLEKAERLKIYSNIFQKDPAFQKLTAVIRSKFLSENGRLMKEFGEHLVKAEKLCLERHASFEDYVDRELGFPRTAAKIAMKVAVRDVPAELGYERMKIVASIRDPEEAKEAVLAFGEGKSVDEVRQVFKMKPEPEDRIEALMKEKQRIAASIERLEQRLKDIERKISEERG